MSAENDWKFMAEAVGGGNREEEESVRERERGRPAVDLFVGWVLYSPSGREGRYIIRNAGHGTHIGRKRACNGLSLSSFLSFRFLGFLKKKNGTPIKIDHGPITRVDVRVLLECDKNVSYTYEKRKKVKLDKITRSQLVEEQQQKR
ncbi:hypothetical protein OUZ56_022108 [Daphnia magna]|uniref:Uncharacterized protein n=1 Tax=Daphnia magna TaxID=35525 RepID=A0ABR0AVF4_9CRUS|nr:hypothetical protein OUZ56_022108 [Daphnia magna]